MFNMFNVSHPWKRASVQHNIVLFHLPDACDVAHVSNKQIVIKRSYKFRIVQTKEPIETSSKLRTNRR